MIKVKAKPQAANKAKEILKKKGLYLSDLAKLVDVSIQHLSRVLNRKVNPSYQLAKKVSGYLDVDFEELFITEGTALDKFNFSTMSNDEIEILWMALNYFKDENVKHNKNKEEIERKIDNFLDEIKEYMS